MCLRKYTKPAISRLGKSFKVWLTLDLYFIITHFGANNAYTFCGKKMTTSVSNLSETLFPQYIMDVTPVSRDVATSNASVELE